MTDDSNYQPPASPPVFDLGQHPDIGEMVAAAGTARRQPLRGFDDDYVDIVDYIVRCTHKIWEEGGIGLIYTHYAHNAVVHTSDGIIFGREKMVADTIHRQAAFPNARGYADDVIWTGNDEDGFHTSHRFVIVGRNTGYSFFGPPTGRWVTEMGVAHCVVKKNLIVEEWIARDGLRMIRQLGLDEHELARQAAAEDAAAGIKPARPLPQGDIERLRGQLPPEEFPASGGDDFDPDAFVRRNIHEIWNWRLLNKINERYAPNYTAYVPTQQTLYGTGDFKAYVLALLSAFPDACVLVDHVCWLPNGPDSCRVAIRWTIHGTHAGPGIYGPPTGKRVRLMGITHQLIQDGKFLKEWTFFDEFILLKQLYAPA